jgi:hypothetical protein
MRDIGAITAQLRERHSGVHIEQLRVTHPGADDDGLWFLSHPGSPHEIQLESGSGNAPFLIETREDDRRIIAADVPSALAVVEHLLRLRIRVVEPSTVTSPRAALDWLEGQGAHHWLVRLRGSDMRPAGRLSFSRPGSTLPSRAVA